LPVGFAEAGDGWFGIAAAPVGSQGARELVVRYAIEPDGDYAAGTEGGWVVVALLPIEILRRDFPARELSVASRYSSPSAEAVRRIEREREEIRTTLAETTPRSYLDGDFRWPRRGRVTAGFGQRRVFNGELQSRHWGLDISGATGEPVRSTARGRVALTGKFYFAGGAVFIDHGLGVYTGYFHLSRIRVAPGDYVERGQLVGDVGATGRVTGAHLHWSLYVSGQSLDASSLLEIEVPEPRPGGPAD
jgi:murein DD-endopeptidase MepM/ murein hydrolase activator NlpD